MLRTEAMPGTIWDVTTSIYRNSVRCVTLKGKVVSYDPHKLHISISPDSDTTKVAPLIEGLLKEAIYNGVIEHYKQANFARLMDEYRQHPNDEDLLRVMHAPYTIYLPTDTSDQDKMQGVIQLCQKIESLLEYYKIDPGEMNAPSDIQISKHLDYRKTDYDANINNLKAKKWYIGAYDEPHASAIRAEGRNSKYCINLREKLAEPLPPYVPPQGIGYTKPILAAVSFATLGFSGTLFAAAAATVAYHAVKELRDMCASTTNRPKK